MDFIRFTGGNVKSTYHRTKALDFFTSLQEIKPLIQKFSNNEFRRSVIFPYWDRAFLRWVVTLISQNPDLRGEKDDVYYCPETKRCIAALINSETGPLELNIG